jgi:hypothetical protein
LLAKDNLVQIAQQRVTTKCKLDLDCVVESIFIIKSLLMAILKDPTPNLVCEKITLSKLSSKIYKVVNAGLVSEFEFFDIDKNFYLVLSHLKGFNRVANIISKENLHINRALRLSLATQADYQRVLKLYSDVLQGIELSHVDSSVSAVTELAGALKNYIITAEKSHPEYFQ